jgi:hypothetical protein
MTRSESINELAAALAQAQAAMAHARKDSENPHFRSRYADLAAIWDACRGALTAHGLAVVQSPRLVSAGDSVWLVELETVLIHGSGQFMSDTLAVPVAASSAQAVGSAVTYCRRYALASFVGVAPAVDDDDGQAASELPVRQIQQPKPKANPRPPAKIPDGPQSVTVKVLGIVQRPMTDGRVKFIVSGDDQKTYQSLHLEHAETAKEAQAAGRPIAIAYTSTTDGRIIQSLTELEAPL